MNPYRIIVTGTRSRLTPTQIAYIQATIRDAIHAVDPGRTVILVHGDCPTGVDQVAEALGNDPDLPHVGTEAHRADWSQYGAAAGPIRNADMVKAGADICLAFPGPASRGTWDCYRKADKAGIPCPSPHHLRGHS